MGIPAYFSHIIKNHTKVIKNRLDEPVTTLLIDSNSIIYDVVHNSDDDSYENIIDNVIEKIHDYVSLIQPTEITYIAFDGIAPYAKMEQQKKRRYKSAFIETITRETSLTKFNTILVTPGTPFMNELSRRMKIEFSGKVGYLLSTPDEFGEGEHKLCQWIRETSPSEQNIVLYGLDADLIMLAIFHLQYTNNIYICRERPEFYQQQDANDNANANELLYLNIKELSKQIVVEMDVQYADPERVNDYVFMCFLLGNDFLPAFPSLSLRTNGMDRLLKVYRNQIGKFQKRKLVDGKDKTIVWKWVNHFIRELAKYEHEFLLQEYSVREKWQIISNNKYKQNISLEEQIRMIPVVCREKEQYICPTEPFWEKRYYRVLFHSSDNVQDICRNYLEGLEWTYLYYTKGCINTHWKYNYHYSPLLRDLSQISATQVSSMVEDYSLITSREQLEYIIPPMYWEQVGLRGNQPSSLNPRVPLLFFCWAFKRYFWEASVE